MAISPYQSHLDCRLYRDAPDMYSPNRCEFCAVFKLPAFKTIDVSFGCGIMRGPLLSLPQVQCWYWLLLPSPHLATSRFACREGIVTVI